MTPLPLFFNTAQVAQMLSFDSPRAFLQQRHRLEADHGFPPPVPLMMKALRWNGEQVQAWAARQGVPLLASNVVALPAARRAVLHLVQGAH